MKGFPSCASVSPPCPSVFRANATSSVLSAARREPAGVKARSGYSISSVSTVPVASDTTAMRWAFVSAT